MLLRLARMTADLYSSPSCPAQRTPRDEESQVGGNTSDSELVNNKCLPRVEARHASCAS